MPKTAVPEWLLARFVGHDRASVILGDLLELSTIRGRLWFWVAYIRAILSLGWRTSVPAFLLAFACVRFMFWTFIPWRMQHRTPHQMMEAGLFGVQNSHLRAEIWNVGLLFALGLCFVAPFILIRFGLRDRLTRLACPLFLIASLVFSLRPWFMDMSVVLIALVLTAALVAPLWRRPLAVLAATFITATAVRWTLLFLLPSIFHRKVLIPPASWIPTSDTIGFAIAAIVCIRLHRRLLDSTPQKTGAYA